MFTFAAIDASNVFEYVLGLIGILGAITSFIFFLANLKIRDVTDKRLISLAQRQQRLYDRTKFGLALQAARTSDIERFLAKDGFFKRSDLQEASLPSDEEDTEM